MNRIIIHWTAGGNKANATDKRRYHTIVEGDGNIVSGNHPFSANDPIRHPNDSSTYAAHTRGANTKAIGIAMAGMRGAKERPFDHGPSPITKVQVAALVEEVAILCRIHGIPVTRETVLTHAEVQSTLGIKQNNKWDVMWLPGMRESTGAHEIGDYLRDCVRVHLSALQPPTARPVARPAPVVVQKPAQSERQGWRARILELLASLIKGKRT